MPRPIRLDLPGQRHHVMNRGARRDAIFHTDDDLARFVHLLSQVPERFNVRVHGYALMPNHFHLMLACPTAGVSTAMQFLQSHYSRWFNREHRWDGPVWRGRFKSRVVDDEDYWRHLLAYLHQNPVRAGLAATADDYPWTSHRAYVGLAPRPPWLSTTELLELYGDATIYDDYQAHLSDLDTPSNFTPLWSSSVAVVHPPDDPPTEAPPRRWPLSREAALQVMADLVDTSPEALIRPRRGPGGNPARLIALWWLPLATGTSQAAMARELGVHPSLLSRAASRVRQGFSDDTPYPRVVERLTSLLPSS